jgi:hypothetical protein
LRVGLRVGLGVEARMWVLYSRGALH